MRTRLILGLAGALVATGPLSGCDVFTDGIDGPIDIVLSDSLNTQDAVPFLATGVKEGFNEAYDVTALLADGLSDQYIFDRAIPSATFPTFEEIDEGDIDLDNNSVDGSYENINEYRFLADDLLRRADETIEFSDDAEGQEAERLARFTGTFHGGIARYFLATYYALNPGDESVARPGAPINASDLIPADQLYDEALAKLDAAKAFVADEYETRVINTIQARIHLFSGDYAAAAAAAEEGLEPGDPPYLARYNDQSPNAIYSSAGQGRAQYSVSPEFVAISQAGDTRVPVVPVTDGDGNVLGYLQNRYPNQGDPLPFVTWQENNLILAEVALRDDPNDSDEEALDLINANRAAAALGDLDEIDLDGLVDERARELFTLGLRLVDQRRFDLFHLPAGTWQYLPITRSERNANDNLPDV